MAMNNHVCLGVTGSPQYLVSGHVCQFELTNRAGLLWKGAAKKQSLIVALSNLVT